MQELDRDPLEYANWRDTGCDLHPSCLECPLPRCIEEQSRGRQRQKMEGRAADMQSLASAGSTVREIAAVYSVSERTVQRELHRKVGLKGCQPFSAKTNTPSLEGGNGKSVEEGLAPS